jgi:hypothetical protein
LRSSQADQSAILRDNRIYIHNERIIHPTLLTALGQPRAKISVTIPTGNRSHSRNADCAPLPGFLITTSLASHYLVATTGLHARGLQQFVLNYYQSKFSSAVPIDKKFKQHLQSERLNKNFTNLLPGGRRTVSKMTSAERKRRLTGMKFTL